MSQPKLYISNKDFAKLRPMHGVDGNHLQSLAPVDCLSLALHMHRAAVGLPGLAVATLAGSSSEASSCSASWCSTILAERIMAMCGCAICWAPLSCPANANIEWRDTALQLQIRECCEAWCTCCEAVSNTDGIRGQLPGSLTAQSGKDCGQALAWRQPHYRVCYQVVHGDVHTVGLPLKL